MDTWIKQEIASVTLFEKEGSGEVVQYPTPSLVDKERAARLLKQIDKNEVIVKNKIDSPEAIKARTKSDLRGKLQRIAASVQVEAVLLASDPDNVKAKAAVDAAAQQIKDTRDQIKAL